MSPNILCLLVGKFQLKGVVWKVCAVARDFGQFVFRFEQEQISMDNFGCERTG